MGHLRKNLTILLEQRTALKRAYAAMRPGRAKTRATIELARIDHQIRSLRHRIAGHGHKKKP